MSIIYKIGIDEVGRGPVAGPVAVGAVLIEINKEEDVKNVLDKITDSKKLSEKKREEYFKKIQELKKDNKLNSAVCMVSAKEIDKFGIVPAIQKSLDCALEKVSFGLKKDKIEVLLDGGLKCSSDFVHQKTIIKGDEKEFVISVASVVAKVLRDKKMKEYAKEFDGYFLEKNKGYGTSKHLQAIRQKGISSIHRKTFLKNVLGE